MNINTKEYWNKRFTVGDWELKSGRWQTAAFARAQTRYIRIPRNFHGTILDFGCGLGDAIPIYREHFSHAKLVGVDFSDAAIRKCRNAYGDMAMFVCGGVEAVPHVDVIIASNVLEHLTDDMTVAEHLLAKCSELYVIVPYMERVSLGGEHVNSYDESSFRELGPCEHAIFRSQGWGLHGLRLYYQGYLKNIFRVLMEKPLVRREYQIMFRFDKNYSRKRDHSVKTEVR